MSQHSLDNGKTRDNTCSKDKARHSMRLSVCPHKRQSSCRRGHVLSIVEESFACQRLRSGFAPTTREDDDLTHTTTTMTTTGTMLS